MSSQQQPQNQNFHQHQNSRSDPTHSHPAGGLIQELEKLQRGRGSSATPKLTTATVASQSVAKTFQSHDYKMDGKFNSGVQLPSNAVPTYRSPISPNSTSRVTQNSLSLRSTRGKGQDVGLFKFPAFKDAEPINPVTEFAVSFSKRLAGLKKKIQASTSLSNLEREDIVQEVDALGHDFVSNSRALQGEFDTSRNEQQRLESTLSQAEARELATLADRDNARSQVLKRQDSFDRLKKSEAEYKKRNSELFQQLQIQKDQFKTRQSDVHGFQDPFASPLASGSPFPNRRGGIPSSMGPVGMMGSPLGSTASISSALVRTSTMEGLPSAGSVYSAFGAMSIGEQTPTGPKALRRGLPVGRPSNRLHPEVTQNSIVESLRNPQKVTEPPSPEHGQPNTISGSLISAQSNNDSAVRYTEKFKEIFKAAEQWCLDYTSLPDSAVDSNMSQTHPSLWGYMMQCTYPRNPHDAQAHIVALLQDSKCRYLLCTRLVVNYCVKEIMTPDEFQNFDREHASKLQSYKTGLSQRGLANSVRQSNIDKQTYIINEIIQNPGFGEFRRSRLTHHAKALRNMLGPLLSKNTVRVDAGKQLGALAAKAWDAGCTLNTSYLTFQTAFPETHSKYLSATMIAKDKPNSTPHELQMAQIRIKLVITPLTTMRDDRGASIQAKELHKAVVLTMA